MIRGQVPEALNRFGVGPVPYGHQILPRAVSDQSDAGILIEGPAVTGDILSESINGGGTLFPFG